jgi:WD40 repeat protein
VAFSPDGKYLASGSRDNTVKLWSVESQKEVTTLLGHSDYVNSVAFSPDGKYLASGSRDETVKLWSIESQK